jgi:hypothetical protein
MYRNKFITIMFSHYVTAMDYERLCKDILNLDPKIRFAGICDETGETKYGGQREGVRNLLSPEETKKSNLQALARSGLRNALAPKLAKDDILWRNMKRLNASQPH